MNPLTARELLPLIAFEGPACLSTYVATGRLTSPETEAAFEEALERARGASEALDDGTLEPSVARVRALLARIGGQARAPAVAAFASPRGLIWFRLPEATENDVAIGRRYRLTPLLRRYQAGGKYFVLQMHGEQASLLVGTLRGTVALDLRALPPELQIALGVDPPQPHAAPGLEDVPLLRGRLPARTRGAQAERTAARREELLSELLDGDGAPLVIAADAPTLALHEEVGRYPYRIACGSAVGREPLTATALRAEIAPRVRAFLEEREQLWLAELAEAPPERRAAGAGEVARLARAGRVERLYFDRALPDAAVEGFLGASIASGGQALSVAGARLPGTEPVAALLRT